MSFDSAYYNSERDRLQELLDSRKSLKERNEMGQFATPYPLACSIMRKAKSFIEKDAVSFIEPSIGLGAFYAAFRSVFGNDAGYALGFELDTLYYEQAKRLWADEDIELRNADFLRQTSEGKRFDMLVANPPYVRHHHIDPAVKRELQEKVLQRTGIKISGLAGLYCYFFILSEEWLTEGGLSCWLIPSEFLDVNYGVAIKQYLLECVDLLCVHKFKAEDVQFDDALVSSSVVFFRKRKPSDRDVVFSCGQDVNEPSKSIRIGRDDLDASDKWSNVFIEGTLRCNDDECRIGDFFTVKRGIATGDNDFFVVDKDIIERYHIPKIFLKPILPSPRYLKDNIVVSGKDGSVELPV